MGVALSYETVRRWSGSFRADHRWRFAEASPVKRHGTWHLDELYLKIDGRMVYLAGERSMLRAMFSMCWSNPSETSTPR